MSYTQLQFSPSPLKLNPVAVRERAKSVPGCTEIPGQEASLVSFLLVPVELTTTASTTTTAMLDCDSTTLARVNIFVDTGTVGTSRVMDGQVRQSFRYNVTSLDVVEQLLKHPEGPMAIHEDIIGLTDTEGEEDDDDDDDDDDVGESNLQLHNNKKKSKTSSITSLMTLSSSLSSPITVQKELELANVGLCILKGEREKLERHLHRSEPDAATEKELRPLLVIAAASTSASSSSTQSKDNDHYSKHKMGTSDKRPSTASKPASAAVKTPSAWKGRDQEEDDHHDHEEGDDHEPESFASSSSSSVSESSSSHCTHSTSSVHGSEFHFKLPTSEVMQQVDQCLRDIAKMEKIVKGVATNGKGTVFLYGNGGVAYTPSIPKALYQKIRQLRSSPYKSRPCFVALGTRDRYFVAFNDGTADWKGPHALDKILKKSLAAAQLPRWISFGSTYDTFFIIFHDGSWQYQGRGIPETLEQKLASRHDRADLVSVNLGPSGEWFLKAENGRMWWSGITQELDGVLTKILKVGYLHCMDFGENGSYFVTYDKE